MATQYGGAPKLETIASVSRLEAQQSSFRCHTMGQSCDAVGASLQRSAGSGTPVAHGCAPSLPGANGRHLNSTGRANCTATSQGVQLKVERL